jgi:hypothetical protein
VDDTVDNCLELRTCSYLKSGQIISSYLKLPFDEIWYMFLVMTCLGLTHLLY